MILPILPAASAAPPTLRLAAPSAAALGEELRRTLPRALVEALDSIGSQIEADILDPLLCAVNVEQLREKFERAFPQFRDYYVSTVHILWAGLREDPQLFSALTAGSFQGSEHLIREHGPRWIGPDASLDALRGLATIVRVTKAATKLLETGKAPGAQPDALDLDRWFDSIVCYWMAFSGVLSSLMALASQRSTSARLENIAVLAQWSRMYASRAYDSAKAMGLLPPAAAEIHEDVELSEVGPESPEAEAGLLGAHDDYTPEQRHMIDAQLAEAEKGPFYGPFDSADEMITHMKGELKRRATLNKVKRSR